MNELAANTTTPSSRTGQYICRFIEKFQVYVDGLAAVRVSEVSNSEKRDHVFLLLGQLSTELST